MRSNPQTAEIFVSDAEIRTLTDYTYCSKQCAWLQNNGIRYVVGSSGKPKVLRAELDRVLFGGIESKSFQPDFSDINGQKTN